jgi:hypothetical protein
MKESEPHNPNESEMKVELPIMTPEEYSQIEHSRPYIYDLQFGDSKLTYFGFGHSNDPEDPAYSELRERFEAVNPDLVLVEGINDLDKRQDEVKQWAKELSSITDEEIIKKHGENLYTLSLALKKGIDFDSPEPNANAEIKYLQEKGFSREEIFVFTVTRDIGQYVRTKEKPELEEYLNPRINKFKRNSNWEGFDYSFENYKKLYNVLFGKELDLNDNKSFHHLVDPIPRKGKEMEFTNRIAQTALIYRDVHIVDQIREKLKTYKKIFVVYGATHAVMQEPALERLAENFS